jgi:hypothetical protein
MNTQSESVGTTTTCGTLSRLGIRQVLMPRDSSSSYWLGDMVASGDFPAVFDAPVAVAASCAGRVPREIP